MCQSTPEKCVVWKVAIVEIGLSISRAQKTDDFNILFFLLQDYKLVITKNINIFKYSVNFFYFTHPIKENIITSSFVIIELY